MRLGSDESAAFFADVVSEKAAYDIIKRFFDEVSNNRVEPITEVICVSFGAVLYQDGLFFDTIYKLADTGVYDNKTNKCNSSTFRKGI